MFFETSDSCGLTGFLINGSEVNGYTTPDSLYLNIGEPGAEPEDLTCCALRIVDQYLMEGQYHSTDTSGNITLHGPDPDCSGTVVLQVSSGQEPQFDWQPDCAVSFMLIEPVGSGTDQWMVGNENENSLNPPLTYGVVPEGLNSREVFPLVAGQVYEVILYKWLGEDDAYLLAGYAKFTP